MLEGAKARILIVDDEADLLLLYKTELEEEGYEVLTAANGKLALETLEKEEVDLIVLDIRMPVMDGLETLGRVIDRERPVKVILNSAFREYRGDFMSWAADAYIEKASDTSQLKAKIREVLGQ